MITIMLDDKEKELIANLARVLLLLKIVKVGRKENIDNYKNYLFSLSENIDMSLKLIFNIKPKINQYIQALGEIDSLSIINCMASNRMDVGQISKLKNLLRGYTIDIKSRKCLKLINDSGVVFLLSNEKIFNYAIILRDDISEIDKGGILAMVLSAVETSSKTLLGKQLITEYSIDNDIDLSEITEEIKCIALLENKEFSYKILCEVLENIIHNYFNSVKVKLQSLEKQKSLLFVLLSLQSIDAYHIWHELILYSAQEYQKLSDVDEEYLEELLSLSKKYIKLRSEILEVITE